LYITRVTWVGNRVNGCSGVNAKCVHNVRELCIVRRVTMGERSLSSNHLDEPSFVLIQVLSVRSALNSSDNFVGPEYGTW
jgi:hypothetical protein